MNTMVGKSSFVSKLSSIDESTRGTKTIIGENCQIDDFVKIKHVGGSGDVVIGDYVYINSCTVIYSGNGVLIGSQVLIGPNCSIVPVNHQYQDPDVPIFKQRFMPSKGGIIIEDDVWIGAGVVLLDGARVSRGCVVAANSVVNSTLEPYSVYGGIPAKLIKKRAK